MKNVYIFMKNIYNQIYLNNTCWYVGNQVEDQVVIQVEREVWDQVENQVRLQIRNQIGGPKVILSVNLYEKYL